ncbi:MAG: hypothetical protein Harvfovirus34_5 [Harvfovirus sp.]|uniref:Uncharacterized protein n=1 Tax=Harvfovirus sp. TaxID=2487768 RepID=A0A3G5A2S8_9VIRU|nr:MAG: hypothetical protein Harvfovirus34_5 [Harvfovirus sp.]
MIDDSLDEKLDLSSLAFCCSTVTDDIYTFTNNVIRKVNITTDINEVIYEISGDSNLAIPTGGKAIYISPDDSYIAITERYGLKAIIINLKTKSKVLDLTRIDYHSNHSQFSLAFTKVADKILLIYTTTWNRLELFDLNDGKLLSWRSEIKYGDKYYLDYFHSELIPSPDGQFVIDSGWIWGPAGVPYLLDVSEWMKNPYQSETPISVNISDDVQLHCPCCWIDSKTFAVLHFKSDSMSEYGDPIEKLYMSLCETTGTIIKSILAETMSNDIGTDCKLFFKENLYFSSKKRTTVIDIHTLKKIDEYKNVHIIAYHDVAKKFIVNEHGKLNFR